MDANTNKKTLSGVFVTLLVGSVFLAAFTNVAAQAPNPSPGVPAAVVDAGLSYTESSTFNSNIVNNITVGTLEFNKTYDLTITNVTGSTGAAWYLFICGASNGTCTAATGSAAAGINPQTAASDDSHPGSGKVNVTFPGVQLGGVGIWRANVSTGVANNATFVVSPVSNLVVTLSKSQFTTSTSSQALTVTVSPLASGETARLGAFNPDGSTNALITPGTTVSGPAGSQTFTGVLAEVGSFFVNATRDLNADTLPEYRGSATVSVVAAGLTVTPVSTTVRSGFAGSASWNITYPSGVAVFTHSGAGTLNNTFVNYNLSVTGPNTFAAYVNASAGGSASGCAAWSVAPTVYNNTLGPGCVATHDTAVTWSYGGDGNFSFAPNSTWIAGTYTFNLAVNKAGAEGSPAEYSTSWSFTPTTPADVNVDLTTNSQTTTNMTVLGTGCTPGTTTIATVKLPPWCTAASIASAALTGAPGYYTLGVTVTGTTQTSHPTAGLPDSTGAFCDTNVTISGDVLDLTSTGGGMSRSYSGSSGSTGGVCTIPGIIPTKGGGNVHVAVSWKGTTQGFDIPVVEGATLAADTSNLIVDTTTAITFTLTDRQGTPVPEGKVFLFKWPSGSAATELVGANEINGTGDAGAGLNGKYTLNLVPNTVGKYVAYGVIGRQEGSSDTRRFAYATFNVVPAHDLKATITPNATMASLPTAYSVNVTKSDGTSLGLACGTAPCFTGYLLNAAQAADLATNGTLTSGVTPPTALSGFTYNLLSGCSTCVLQYNFTKSLAPDTYKLYICDAAVPCTSAKHDNNGSMPSLVVSKYKAVFSPAAVADNANIQANTTVNVTITDSAGAGLNGTLTLSGADSTGFLSCAITSGTCAVPANTTTLSVPIGMGHGSFVATGLIQGDVAFKFSPNNATAAPATSLVDGVLKVVGPNVVVNPSRVPVGKTSTVTVTVKSLTGTPLPNLTVRLCGIPLPQGCTENKTTDANGLSQVGVFPTTTGTLTMQVSGVPTTTTIAVFAGLDVNLVPANPVENDTVTLTVTQVGQTAGESDVSVNVTYEGAAVSGFPKTTLGNGQVVVPSVKAGNYTVTATKTGYDSATITFVVSPKAVVPPTPTSAFELSNLDAPATGTVGTAMTVKVDVTNSGTADGSATVLLLVDGAQQDSKTVFVGKGSKETAAFSFAFTSAGSHTVSAKLAGGTALAAKTVTVSTPATSTPVSSTPASSTPASSTPSSTPSTPPSSTPAPTPKVPGFEVVALLGALAVAMLVLRRRN